MCGSAGGGSAAHGTRDRWLRSGSPASKQRIRSFNASGERKQGFKAPPASACARGGAQKTPPPPCVQTHWCAREGVAALVLQSQGLRLLCETLEGYFLVRRRPERAAALSALLLSCSWMRFTARQGRRQHCSAPDAAAPPLPAAAPASNCSSHLEAAIPKMSITLTQLHVYPVKGCRGIPLDSAVVTPTGEQGAAHR